MTATLSQSSTLISEPLSTNRLAIILDESEGTGNFEGAMLRAAFALFIQKATPFLMPAALWDIITLQKHIAHDVQTVRKTEFDTRHSGLRAILNEDYDTGVQALKLMLTCLHAYKKNETKEAKQLSLQLKKLLLKAHDKELVQEFAESTAFTARIPITRADWYCTPYDNGRFLLFVPKAYASAKGDSLGLTSTKKSIAPTLTNPVHAWQRFQARMDALFQGSAQQNLGAAFLTLFPTLFTTPGQTTPQRWALYLIGHGQQEKKEIRYEQLDTVYSLKNSLADVQENLTKEQDALYKAKSKQTTAKQSLVHQKSIQKHEANIQILKQKMQRHTDRLNELLKKEEKVETTQPTLASLSIPEFKTFLKQLQKINTTVFAYMTCFAAGSTQYKLYQHDQEQHVIDQYPFVIGSAGVAAATTISPAVSDFDNYPPEETIADIRQYKNPNVRAIADYNLFFSLCEKDESVDWPTAFNAIFAYTKFPKYNLPLVKFPGTHWFSVPALDDVIISLSKVMAATREPHNQLVLENQKAILVYAPEIPFAIRYAPRKVANKIKDVPTFVSMLPGYAHHALTTLYAPEYEASRVLKSFFEFPDAQDEKIFSIEKIEVSNDIFPNNPNKIITLYDVFCINHAQTIGLGNMFSARPKNGNLLCCTLDGTAYGWAWPSEGDILFSAHPPQTIDPRYIGLLHLSLGGSTRYRTVGYTSAGKSYTPTKEEFTPAKRELLKKIIEKKLEEIKQKKLPYNNQHK